MPYVCFPVCEAVVWAQVLRGSSTELSPAGCLSAQQEENQTQGAGGQVHGESVGADRARQSRVGLAVAKLRLKDKWTVGQVQG